MTELVLNGAASVPRVRLRELRLHVELYLLAAVFAIAWQPVPLTTWDLSILVLAVGAAITLAVRSRPHSRAILLAMGLAGLGALTQARGPALLAHTLASSQAHILAMACTTVIATGAYAISNARALAGAWASGQRLSWAALVLGASGLLLRWWESYQVGDGYMGHVPISNLYEVFVLFVLIALAFQLHIQRDARLRAVGAILSVGASAAACFVVWYATTRRGHELQPLVPALDSYWMKLHVPANFIGYGAFCLAALTSSAWLLAGVAALKHRLPERALLEELSYRLIAIGFVAFTIATILGALWAAEAWGGYWSWDPKETWALIVWLNYAAWLHQRMVKGRRGSLNAWWSLIGLVITLFAFLGVNMYLSGLHSYGGL